MAASYIEALLPAPFDTDPGAGTDFRDWRWNNTSPLQAAVNVAFSFMDSVPVHANPDDNNNFIAFTNAQKTAAGAVLGMYEEISKITFTENPVGETGQILFGRNTQGSAGYAYFPDLIFDPAGDLGGDVWLNRSEPGNSELAPGEHGLATLIHEIGHALGLKHPAFYGEVDQPPYLTGSFESKQYTAMSYTEHPRGEWRELTITGGGTGYSASYSYIQPSTPMLYDIAAIQYLYGKNMTTRTGNDTYEFDRDDPFLMGIWDAGGTDTISVSNFSRGCTIDLNAGKFSSITILPEPLPFGTDTDTGLYNGSNNLSIAFGVTIENAIGGSGADKLTGNAVKNVLTGNGGNDTLAGGAGNDNLNGGTGADRLLGGSGNDILVWQSSDKKVDGGTGSADVLKVTSSTLNLVGITNQALITNIETIDMNGGGNNKLTLAKNDVLDISSTTNTLKILGDAGDIVDLTGFTRGGLSNGFVTWKAGTAILKIEDDIVSVV